MFRNYVTAALRNLVRNRLYAAINIIGLAVGFAAALLIALFVRDEFSYDRYFPDHEHIYLLRSTYANAIAGMALQRSDYTPGEIARLLKLDFPFIEKIARFSEPERISIRRGGAENVETILWADPGMLEILKFRSIAGDLTDALANPESIILTRAMARKYFGKDNVVGKTLEIDRFGEPREIDRKKTFTVTAVIEDLPSNVNLPVTFIAAGQSVGSPLARLDARPPPYWTTGARIYMKLRDRAAVQHLEQGLSDFHKPEDPWPGFTFEYHLVPIDELHFASGHHDDENIPRGSMEAIVSVGAIALLIMFAAGINFVNLMTARAARRAVEVGVRKATGAARAQLVIQFVGEAIIYVAIGMVLALSLAALLLPSLNAFLGRTIGLDLLSDVRSGIFIIGLVLGLGVLAGLYPAFVLSSFRPALVLKAGMVRSQASGAIRQVLVVLQFALLIGLLIATAVMHRQTQFALTEAQRLDTDAVAIVQDRGPVVFANQSPCGAFKDAASALPGMRGAVCSRNSVDGGMRLSSIGPDGESVLTQGLAVDPDFFKFYGLKPVAGRFFPAGRSSDMARRNSEGVPAGGAVVLNETAVRKFGFPSPWKAIGQTVRLAGPTSELSEVVGVVQDYAIDTVHASIPPMLYFVDAEGYSYFDRGSGATVDSGVLSLRLDGARIPETLREIDKLWKQYGQPRPIDRYFLDQAIQARYADITRQGTLFAVAAGVAAFIALLGLFGMSAFAAEQRTKEIGIRKAMGATKRDILRLLLWQFTKPVLWANLIAWPVAYFIMRRWLEGFAYHVALEPWVLLTASVLALVIALATVAGHALLVARAKPVAALRYE